MPPTTSIPKITWLNARPERVVLVTGPEDYFADRAWAMIRGALRDADPALEVHELDASEYAGGELFTLASPSLFGEPRLIHVLSMEKSTDAFIADAKRYVVAPDDDTTVVVRHGGGMRGKAVLDLIRKGTNGVEVLCPEVKASERIEVVREELRRLGGQADLDALRALVDAFQGSIEELMGALKQVVQLAGGRVRLTDVERVTGGRVEADAFRVADAALSGNATLALVLLRQSLSTGHAPMQILAGVNYKVRAMARLFGLQGSPAQLAKQVGGAPWQIERAQRDARGWAQGNLARVIDEAAATEMQLKGGARNPEYALERFVLLLARRGTARKHE